MRKNDDKMVRLSQRLVIFHSVPFRFLSYSDSRCNSRWGYCVITLPRAKCGYCRPTQPNCWGSQHFDTAAELKMQPTTDIRWRNARALSSVWLAY